MRGAGDQPVAGWRRSGDTLSVMSRTDRERGGLAEVLIVDDDPDIRQIARLSLEQIGGLRVHLAASAGEALRLLLEIRPDVILLDVLMPDLDGPAALAALRAIPGVAKIPVLFVTARAQPDEIARLRALGVAGVVTKPFDPLTLPDEIRRLAGKAP
jgi:two-component system, OmpR family, response regulator